MHTSALQPGGKAHYNLHEHAFTTLALFHRLFSVFLVRRWYLVGLVKLASKPGIRCEATIGEWGQCTGGGRWQWSTVHKNLSSSFSCCFQQSDNAPAPCVGFVVRSLDRRECTWSDFQAATSAPSNRQLSSGQQFWQTRLAKQSSIIGHGPWLYSPKIYCTTTSEQLLFANLYL